MKYFFPRAFGETVRNYRISNNKTMGEVARKLNVKVSYVSSVEHGMIKSYNNEELIHFCELISLCEEEYADTYEYLKALILHESKK